MLHEVQILLFRVAECAVGQVLQEHRRQGVNAGDLFYAEPLQLQKLHVLWREANGFQFMADRQRHDRAAFFCQFQGRGSNVLRCPVGSRAGLERPLQHGGRDAAGLESLGAVTAGRNGHPDGVFVLRDRPACVRHVGFQHERQVKNLAGLIDLGVDPINLAAIDQALNANLRRVQRVQVDDLAQSVALDVGNGTPARQNLLK